MIKKIFSALRIEELTCDIRGQIQNDDKAWVQRTQLKNICFSDAVVNQNISMPLQ